MHQLTLAEIARGLKDKTFSSAELTDVLLARIAQLDPQLNSFITVTEELARTQAQAADARRAAGEEGALLGAPIGHKDLFCTQGVLTSCASKILSGFKAPYNAIVVDKLAAAGTVTLGKLNMDEFAMGSANESSHYGPVKNPWDLARVPGGSSGGSGAAGADSAVANGKKETTALTTKCEAVDREDAEMLQDDDSRFRRRAI